MSRDTMKRETPEIRVLHDIYREYEQRKAHKRKALYVLLDEKKPSVNIWHRLWKILI
jgi:hypothetical protein